MSISSSVPKAISTHLINKVKALNNMLMVCNWLCPECAGDLSLQRLSDRVLDYNNTQKCPTSNNNVQTSISFQCGKTMVRLRYMRECFLNVWFVLFRELCLVYCMRGAGGGGLKGREADVDWRWSDVSATISPIPMFQLTPDLHWSVWKLDW